MNRENIDPVELEFLEHSNWIEDERSEEALEDAHLAWEYLKKQDITLESVLTTHLLIMRRVNNEIAGKIRNCDVWIGGKKKIFIAEKLIRDDLISLFDAMDASKKLSSMREECVKAMHIDFERIHPFVDGNGRTGRHVMNRHRLELGLPIHVIHEGEEQQEYYGWFK